MAAELSGFDPGYFFPDYPGALSGKFDGTGERDAQGRWKGDARLADLRGSLRKRPVQGQAVVHFLDGSGNGELSLRIGNSRIEAGGSYGEQLDLRAQFSPLDLADLLAGAAGRLNGHVAMRGARSAPAYEAKLQGEGLRWDGLAAGSLSADGRLPASGRDGDLNLSAQGVTLGGQQFESATLTLTGSVAAFHANASLSGDAGSFDAKASASGQGAQWQGRLEYLRIAPSRGPAWHLQAGSGFRYQSGDFQLDRACLVPEAPGGQLCAQANGQRATISGVDLPLTMVEPWLPATALTLQPFGEVDFNGEFARERSGGWGGQAQLRSAVGGLRDRSEISAGDRQLFRSAA